MPWLHDVFISYPRGGDVGRWVAEHLEPRLRGRLTDGWTRSPRPKVFLDERALGAGDGLDDVLRKALGGSRVIVPVLTPSYASRPYCCGELETFLARERVLGSCLVVPVLAWDCAQSAFPGLGDRVVQDLRHVVYVGPCFEGTPQYLKLQDGVRSVVDRILAAIATCPDEPDPSWPIADLPRVDGVIPTFPMPWLKQS